MRTALVEMRPEKLTPAHKTGMAAELVCSNSLRSDDPLNAVGLLKREMEALASLVIASARASQVPAGSALAVDRGLFSEAVTCGLAGLNTLTRISGLVTGISRAGEGLRVGLEDGRYVQAARVVIASGPLTADALVAWILEHTRRDTLYFYDSISPIIEQDSINTKIAFRASRYDKGGGLGDYLNCPLSRSQYERFIATVAVAELVPVHDFERAMFFEACLPIEEMVRRGPDTLRFGPMKPVGLVDPSHPDERPYAVVQLRQDNLHGSLYNMVGFQTRMKWGEQKRIFTTIPGLENAEFVRFGSLHRNTYICSPALLNGLFELRDFPGVHFAGQISGCEGYVESAATGLYLGTVLAALLKDKTVPVAPPRTTALGALIHHILTADPENFQPMNVNFGLFSELPGRGPKRLRKEGLVARARADFGVWLSG